MKRDARQGSSTQRVRADPLIAILVVIVTVGLLSTVARRGWIPLDEGTLAQTASRILDGQIPHVDFLDVYPGFQGLVHALLFSVFGESLSTLRIGWLAMGGVAALSAYALLANRLSHAFSAVAACSIVVFSFVIYPASMPSWWNSALGLAGVAVAYTGWKRDRRVLLVIAGAILGLSALTKSTGGLLVAAPVGLWLANLDSSAKPLTRRVAFVVAAGLAVGLIAPAMTLGRALFLGIPVGCALYALSASMSSTQAASHRAHNLVRPYLIGLVAFPLATIVAYSLAGRGAELLRGWVVIPATRFENAERDIPISLALGVLCVVGYLIIRLLRSRAFNPRFLAGIPFFVILIAATLDWPFLGTAVLGVIAFIPLVVGGALLRLGRPHDPLVILVASTSLMFIMIQIPFWNGYYIAYSMPLLLVAMTMMVRLKVVIIPSLVLLACLFLVQTAAGRLVTAESVSKSVTFVELRGDRGGLLIPYWDEYYNDLTDRLAVVADESSVYAGPDSPEVAFLAGVEQQTPAFFEVLDPDWDDSMPGDLAEAGSVVVINHAPSFTSPLPPAELERIRRANSESETFDHFELTFAGSSER